MPPAPRPVVYQRPGLDGKLKRKIVETPSPLGVDSLPVATVAFHSARAESRFFGRAKEYRYGPLAELDHFALAAILLVESAVVCRGLRIEQRRGGRLGQRPASAGRRPTFGKTKTLRLLAPTSRRWGDALRQAQGFAPAYEFGAADNPYDTHNGVVRATRSLSPPGGSTDAVASSGSLRGNPRDGGRRGFPCGVGRTWRRGARR